MPKYQVEVQGLNDNVLKSVVKIHNKENGTNFTPTSYLNWILNKWFSNKQIENRKRVPT
jgi:hypothetical protein